MLTLIRSSVIFFLVVFLFPCRLLYAQALKPGFDADEYLAVLERCAMQVDKDLRGHTPKETAFEKVYHSPEMGLHNKWDLWINKDKTIMAINLRGTTSDPDSWLENFYSATIPAIGSLKLDGKTAFEYKFANDPRAKVHVGWSLGVCCLAPDIMEKIKTWYAKGVKQFIIEGHSQGGALAFLLTSYIHYKIVDGTLPKDLIIKTYCSASPKTGNTYYAYDFDNFTRGGWAFTVVSAADWVPEMPLTVQTQYDINLNPFTYTKKGLHKQNFIVRYYITHIYNSLDRATRKAERKSQKFLGKVLYTQIKKYMKEYKQPEYAGCVNYMRAGCPIVLEPDADYYKKFPDTGSNIFRNHLFEPYYYLVQKTYR